MEYAKFIRKQLQWAKRHGESVEDTQRAQWWLTKIKEVEAEEAKAFPAPAPIPAEHPGQQPAA